MEPRIEAIGVTQPAQVLPCSDQGILDRVLRHLVVAQDEAGDTKQATRTARRQRRERIEVTLPGTNDEVALDRTTLWLRRRTPAFSSVWALESRICSVFDDGHGNGRDGRRSSPLISPDSSRPFVLIVADRRYCVSSVASSQPIQHAGDGTRTPDVPRDDHVRHRSRIGKPQAP